MIRPKSYKILDLAIGGQIQFDFHNGVTKTVSIHEGTQRKIFLYHQDRSYIEILPDNSDIRTSFVRDFVGYETYGSFPEIELEDLPKLLDALVIPEDMGIAKYINRLSGFRITTLGGNTVYISRDEPIPDKFTLAGIQEATDSNMQKLYYEWQTYTKNTPISNNRFMRLP